MAIDRQEFFSRAWLYFKSSALDRSVDEHQNAVYHSATKSGELTCCTVGINDRQKILTGGLALVPINIIAEHNPEAYERAFGVKPQADDVEFLRTLQRCHDDNALFFKGEKFLAHVCRDLIRFAQSYRLEVVQNLDK